MKQHPVTIVAYNRPAHFARVLAAVQKYYDGPICIFVDGPKNAADVPLCTEVRRLAYQVKGAHIQTNTTNAGLRQSILDAVDETLYHYDTLMLLEDDCVPGAHFFSYMTTCLDMYQNKPEVMGISGYTIPISEKLRASYPWDVYFVPRAGSWGWATWKRAWDWHIFDTKEVMDRLRAEGIDVNRGGSDVAVYAKQVIDEGRDLWTPAWIISVYLANGIYAYPTMSHVTNIGWDGSGVNCTKSTRYETYLATVVPRRFPLNPVTAPALSKNFRQRYK